MKVTVNETQSNEVDWSKNPQLVVSDFGTIILTSITQNNPDKTRFSGIVLSAGDNSGDYRGDYSQIYFKPKFKPFHGSITLSND